jgi:nucleoside-diphosphate-sugar epimerase
MKIFITGGLGFIGSYLTDKLINQGHQVYIYDKIINFADNLPYFQNALAYRKKMFSPKPKKIYHGDIRKVSLVKSALSDCKPDIVVHLAAVTMARPPKKFAHLMGPINLYGSLNVLQAFEDSPSAKRIIFPSSSFAYGHYVKNPQPEESYLKPVNDYGIMKAACEYAVQLSKKEWVIVRPTSVYGFTDCANRVTQLLWDAAIYHKPAWVVKDESLDFTYIDDVIKGLIKTITMPQAANQIFNLSRGKSRNTAEFAEILKKHFPNFNYEIRNSSNSVINRGAQDMTKAAKILKFIPKFDIEDGIKDTIRLMKKFGQIK